ncbi:protein FAM205C [Nannospalax galili]|uniref:SPATA31-like domain-containing protein n=1 Tax=Nannospalax galili TaxID=1026970 RepID=A0A8C6QKJ8_NANGA|nr:protein FAM205C [Nannospalax galili]
MLMPTLVLWDAGYHLYTYGSIFIIVLIIWHMKRSRGGLRLEPIKNCCKCHRRVKQRPRDRTSRVMRTSKEEAEKFQKLLSTMKSQGWLPQEGSVRQLLCADPSCKICNAVALEIQQLLGFENKKPSPILLRPSQSSSCLDTLSTSKVMFEKSQELSSQHSRNLSVVFGQTSSQLTGQKLSTQSAAPSTDDANVQCYNSDHKRKQGFQGSKVSQDAGSQSSSSLEEPGAPSKQQKRRKNNTSSVSKQKAPEVEVENKMTFFSHWINPELKCERHEEPILLSNSETVAKPRTKEVEKNQASKDQEDEANTEKTTKHPKDQALPIKNM